MQDLGKILSHKASALLPRAANRKGKPHRKNARSKPVSTHSSGNSSRRDSIESRFTSTTKHRLADEDKHVVTASTFNVAVALSKLRPRLAHLSSLCSQVDTLRHRAQLLACLLQ